MITEKDLNRLWSKIDRRGDDECWLWTGCTGHGDVPQWSPSKGSGVSRYPVRAMWEFANGLIPESTKIRKLCGVARCCNPKHMKLFDELSDRFWSKADKTPGNGIGDCWFWTSTIDKMGRGTFKVSAKRGNVQAHRQAYELAKGAIPEGLCVLHVCDVGKCVNPDHLFVGTQKDNVQDAINKGRWIVPYNRDKQDMTDKQVGSKNNYAKLDEDKVKEIKKMLDRGLTHKTIASYFDVSRATIGAIHTGKAWTHVK